MVLFLMLEQNICYLMTHSDTFKMDDLQRVYDILKRAMMCLCQQHPEQNTLFTAIYSSHKTNSDEIQGSL